MHILLLTQYFWPEVGAPQVIHAEWISRLTARGHKVSVITTFPNYPDGVIKEGYRGKVFQKEERFGATIYRTATYAAKNAGTAKRLLNHLVFAGSSLTAMPRVSDVDVIMTEYPPLFTSFTGLLSSKLRGIPHVLNAGDLWVEAAIQMGMLKGTTADIFLNVAKRVEQHSAKTIVTAIGCVDKLRSYGLPDSQISYLPNSVDTVRFAPDPIRRQHVRAARGFSEEDVVALYHGTHGLSQGLSTVIDAASRLAHLSNLKFVLIGDGADKSSVVAHASSLGLRNVQFLEPEPFEQMAALVAAADIGLVPLKKMPLFEITLPSKMFEFMSSEVAVALGVSGNARDIITDANAGLAYEPEDSAGLAKILESLYSDGAARRRMGSNGRRAAVERYSRDRFAADLEQIFFEVTAQSARRKGAT